MEEEPLKKFGRYFLLYRIAQGGMAEIYLARLTTLEGDGRFLVIKRVQSGFWENAEFLQMFKSEIRVTMGLNHPNIVQLYDYGEEAGRPFIAMEHVDGKNLRQFIARFNDLKEKFPVDIAAHIIEQVASGLHYAHNFKDKMTGSPLSIVHRDISPQNILISTEAAVKVIDFGIAKASTNAEATKFGIIKGKPSYLSPEQITGEKLDCRSDVFSLGIVLWELLVGKKLFAGTNELAVLRLIESCTSHVKPPSYHNKKVPPEMDELTLKALAKDPDQRFQTAQEFQRAMHRFLYSQFPEFNPSELTYFVKDLFKNEIVEERKRMRRLNEQAQKLIESNQTPRPQNKNKNEDGVSGEIELEDEDKDDTTSMVGHHLRSGAREVFSDSFGKTEPGDPGESKNKPNPESPVARIKPKNPELQLEALPPSVITNSQSRADYRQYRAGSSLDRKIPKQKRSRGSTESKVSGLRFFLIAVLASVGIYSYVWQDPPWVGDGKESLVLQSLDPAGELGVTIKIDGKDVGTKLPMVVQPVVIDSPIDVRVESAERGVFRRNLKLKKGEVRKLMVEYNLKKSVPTLGDLRENEVRLILRVTPCSGLVNIRLNEKPLDRGELRAVVETDRPIELTLEQPGFKMFQSEFTIFSQSRNPGQDFGSKEYVKYIELEPIKFGRLEVRASPSAEIFIFLEGEPTIRYCELRTPLIIDKFPVGNYSFHLINSVLGAEKKLNNLKLEESKILRIDEELVLKKE